MTGLVAEAETTPPAGVDFAMRLAGLFAPVRESPTPQGELFRCSPNAALTLIRQKIR